MENRGVIYQKSYAFAIRIVKAYKYLCQEKNEYVLSKQLLRSGTSIGANCSEARNAQSTLDFINKLYNKRGFSEYEIYFIIYRYWYII